MSPAPPTGWPELPHDYPLFPPFKAWTKLRAMHRKGELLSLDAIKKHKRLIVHTLWVMLGYALREAVGEPDEFRVSDKDAC